LQPRLRHPWIVAPSPTWLQKFAPRHGPHQRERAPRPPTGRRPSSARLRGNRAGASPNHRHTGENRWVLLCYCCNSGLCVPHGTGTTHLRSNAILLQCFTSHSIRLNGLLNRRCQMNARNCPFIRCLSSALLPIHLAH